MNKKSLAITFVAFVVCAAGGGLLYARYHGSKQDDTRTIVEQKKNAPDQSVTDAQNNNKPAQDVSVSSSVALADLKATQTGGLIRATAGVSNSTDIAATCVFTFENDEDKPVVRQMTVTSGGKVCDSGNIPQEEFTLIGKWKLTLRYYTNNSQVVATTDITVQ